MKYVIEAFDKTTELLVFEVAIPAIYGEDVKKIMEWESEQEGWEGYGLSADQLVAMEKLTSEPFDASAFDFQLTVNT